MHRTKRYRYRGQSHTVQEWSGITGISVETLHYRLTHGWPVKRALTQSVEPQKFLYRGRSRTLRQWSEITKIPLNTLRTRLYQKWPLERVLGEPRHDRTSKRLTYRGKTRTLRDWARAKRMSQHTLYNRLFTYGWDLERALTERPARRRRRKQ